MNTKYYLNPIKKIVYNYWELLFRLNKFHIEMDFQRDSISINSHYWQNNYKRYSWYRNFRNFIFQDFVDRIL